MVWSFKNDYDEITKEYIKKYFPQYYQSLYGSIGETHITNTSEEAVTNPTIRGINTKKKGKNKTMKYRKKPVIIEAYQWYEYIVLPVSDDFEYMPEWLREAQNNGTFYVVHPENEDLLHPAHYFIKTLEGDMEVSSGDYIIKGVNGELYSCKPDIFEETYEKVED